MANNRSLGVICLCLFLLVFGLLAITNFRFVGAEAVEGVLAILAAVFLWLGR